MTRAIILVGGFGTRLRPLTYTIPKQMLPVVELPMIERKIAHLMTHGIDDIVLSMGYRPDAFRDAYPSGVCAGASVTYVVESEPLNTAGALAFAARQASITETFLAFNGDTLTDIDIAALIALHRERDAEGTIALTPVEDPSRFGVVPTESDGRVRAFIEKPAQGEAPTNLINAGAYVLEPSFLDRVKPGAVMSIERDVFPAMVAAGRLYAGHFDTYWLDIGTPEAYLQGNLDVLDGPYHEMSATIKPLDGEAWANGEVFVKGTVGGRSFLGVGATVAEGANVHHSVLGAGANVSADAHIIDSVLLSGASVGAGAVIEHSIIGEHGRVGTGAHVTGLTVIGGNMAVEAGAHLTGERVSPPNTVA